MKDVEFQEKQFLKLEAELRPLQRLLVSRQMDVVQRLGQRHEVVTLHQFGGQGLSNVLHPRRIKQIYHKFVDGPRRKLAIAQYLGKIIYALQALRDILGVSKVNLGVDDIQTVIEHRRLAKQDVLSLGIIGLLNRGHAVEPHHIDGSCAI